MSAGKTDIEVTIILQFSIIHLVLAEIIAQ